jgi:hypothetical protein
MLLDVPYVPVATPDKGKQVDESVPDVRYVAFKLLKDAPSPANVATAMF